MIQLRKILIFLLSKLPKSIFHSKYAFETFQSRGTHVTPVHFYLPTPNTELLGEQVWKSASDLPGIKTNSDSQESLLVEFSEKYIKEFRQLPETFSPPAAYSRDVGVIPPLLAEVLSRNS